MFAVCTGAYRKMGSRFVDVSTMNDMYKGDVDYKDEAVGAAILKTYQEKPRFSREKQGVCWTINIGKVWLR